MLLLDTPFGTVTVLLEFAHIPPILMTGAHDETDHQGKGYYANWDSHVRKDILTKFCFPEYIYFSRLNSKGEG